MSRYARDVFISFAEEDIAAARTVRELLRGEGLSSWVYKDESFVGEWKDIEFEVMRECRAMFVLISEHFSESGECLREIKYADQLADEKQEYLIAGLHVDHARLPDKCWERVKRWNLPELRGRGFEEVAEQVVEALAYELSDDSVLPQANPEGSQAVAEPLPLCAVMASWTADRAAVSVRVVAAHADAGKVRSWLVTRYGSVGGRGRWMFMRSEYLEVVAPGLEKLVGAGACPLPETDG